MRYCRVRRETSVGVPIMPAISRQLPPPPLTFEEYKRIGQKVSMKINIEMRMQLVSPKNVTTGVTATVYAVSLSAKKKKRDMYSPARATNKTKGSCLVKQPSLAKRNGPNDRMAPTTAIYTMMIGRMYRSPHRCCRRRCGGRCNGPHHQLRMGPH